MTRAAIYARYSSDRQRATSIDDQVRLCRARAEREGWAVVAVHSDREMSGSTPIAMRPGAASLMAEALAGDWDVLIIEGLDRLCRDLGEQERSVPRLEHAGIRLIGIADGYDSEHQGRLLMRGARGLVNALYLDDLRHKTHRGLAGRFAAGFSAGGCPYGYRAIEADGGRTLEIHPEQARWVVWIYQRYAEGWSARRIAAEMNRRGIPSPKGRTWAASAIYGHRAKGTGIVRNDLYAGTWTWNRSQWIKDPRHGGEYSAVA